jgi:hypothetical protein
MNKIGWGQNCNLEKRMAKIGIRVKFALIHSHVCGCGLWWKNNFAPQALRISPPSSSFLFSSIFLLPFFFLLHFFFFFVLLPSDPHREGKRERDRGRPTERARGADFRQACDPRPGTRQTCERKLGRFENP